eukprot:COSAG04_NODE_618_length_11896_cov_81.925659_26_plen_88_part_00
MCAGAVPRELGRFWDLMAIDSLRGQGTGRWKRAHGLLVSKRATVSLRAYSRLHVRIGKDNGAIFFRISSSTFCRFPLAFPQKLELCK